MERRTFESPMDWEYQNSGPLDPTSPFVQSAQRAQNNNAFGLPRTGTFGQQNSFSRTQSSPQKPGLTIPAFSSSIFPSSNSHLQRTNTAPPFRNPAFTTPRKPFDMDAVSEASAAEDSPALTDAESCPNTPETDNMRSFGQMTLTPARSKALSSALSKRSPGKGEIPRGSTAFGTRDKVRKRKRRHDDKDISGFRLPYKHPDEWDDTEGNDSDDSVYQPNDHHGPDAQSGRRRKGWISGFLSVIQKHPDAPIVLGSWVTLLFNLAVVGLALWLLWVVVASFRDDFWAAKQELRAVVVEEMARCARDYADNRCSPREQRLPAMNAMCDEWEACMNQNPDNLMRVRLGARNIVEILNEIIETMHWKTLAAFIALFAIFCFSGISLVKSSQAPSNFAFVPHPPQSSQSAFQPHPSIMYGHVPQTPRTRYTGHLQNDDTPDTDASPSDMKSLPPPSYWRTPSGRRSPSKGDGGRSPTKSRSPAKRY
ncbi:putative Di-sulfide bridge nucleocytoplasmic transport domain-containing protein [Seiridium cardinale]|uniref:Di-sulfide bridge nucleocytoplasmic transport domain-containing protein n=1 Tax=Seiridium cardinale TaxID=138064 RepID=A0ABR2XP24_9PEZI